MRCIACEHVLKYDSLFIHVLLNWLTKVNICWGRGIQDTWPYKLMVFVVCHLYCSYFVFQSSFTLFLTIVGSKHPLFQITIFTLEILYMWDKIPIDKIVGYGLAYILGELILLIPYDFWETINLTKCIWSQQSWPVGLWARAHGCPVSTWVYVTNYHGLTIRISTVTEIVFLH